MPGAVPDGHPETKTALLVIDMQVYFTEMSHQAKPQIMKLIQFFRGREQPVVFTQHGHSKEELTPPIKNQVIKRWGVENSIAVGSREWRLIPEIQEYVQQSPVIAKNTYDAFVGTDMLPTLQSLHVERVVICGVMTDCCCTTTARSAFNHGFETWLAEDACETVDQKQQGEGIDGYDYAYSGVYKTDAILKKLEEG